MPSDYDSRRRIVYYRGAVDYRVGGYSVTNCLGRAAVLGRLYGAYYVLYRLAGR